MGKIRPLQRLRYKRMGHREQWFVECLDVPGMTLSGPHRNSGCSSVSCGGEDRLGEASALLRVTASWPTASVHL